MERKLSARSSTRLLVPVAMIALMSFGPSMARAQTGSQSQNARSAIATSGSGE
jgi:hypothetical protein